MLNTRNVARVSVDIKCNSFSMILHIMQYAEFGDPLSTLLIDGMQLVRFVSAYIYHMKRFWAWWAINWQGIKNSRLTGASGAVMPEIGAKKVREVFRSALAKKHYRKKDLHVGEHVLKLILNKWVSLMVHKAGNYFWLVLEIYQKLPRLLRATG